VDGLIRNPKRQKKTRKHEIDTSIDLNIGTETRRQKNARIQNLQPATNQLRQGKKLEQKRETMIPPNTTKVENECQMLFVIPCFYFVPLFGTIGK